MQQVKDGTFFPADSDGGFDIVQKQTGVGNWEIQEYFNDAGKVVFRLYIQWNNYTDRDYPVKFRKQPLQTPATPAQTYVKPY
ncbi:MAG: hypothetical protein A2X13_14730 [Bacteroidetes bacterium GWC2_33_15]|nr:MAG: hypothetical protein A2X10_06795 [Bacteroidetes bacterium GWA2_33_15]OFX50128.1 MAG: hypothetical protein A2X13_14730 [Bacteroidetes bacterium GWC2_33_15]OFX65281.1 MAG: hypothetical protein A2X15_04305 [Bacteroidetes bacterium GWB2_32_14]OFX70507.1 MAG: hypothetical protein A2X14_04360 [Bacteroidetes bacterium GWD2_33_33]HAN19620.1 hypothetical protein [Bacteroidales bacterium]